MSKDRSRAGRTSLALGNLRAWVILLVLAFHSSLAYLAFLPAHPFAFDAPPFAWRAFPIIDPMRSVGLELFCAWQDVFLMTLFFFLSGLFVWPSLKRKGIPSFIADRFKRLGLPFAVFVALLMPVAQYPTYLQTATDPSIGAYVRTFLALRLWPCGPMWFLWLLLAADLLAVAATRVSPNWGERLAAASGIAVRRPFRYFTLLFTGSALAYVPLALVFTPEAWGEFGPFALQLSRPLHYAIFFFAGAGLGACGIENGLLGRDGALVRHWRLWVALALSGFALWLALTAPVAAAQGPVSPALQVADDFGFVFACLCNCLGVLAVALRFATKWHSWLDSLSQNAYAMYLVHYPFVIWLQYALLPLDTPGVIKAGTVFVGTLALSWGSAGAFRRLSPIAAAMPGRRDTAAVRPS